MLPFPGIFPRWHFIGGTQMKTTSIFSVLVMMTAFGLSGSSAAQAQSEAYITPSDSTRFAVSAPAFVTEGVSDIRQRAPQGGRLADLVHQYQVAINETSRLIKLATTDEEREALKAQKAELEHEMITVQQSNS